MSNGRSREIRQLEKKEAKKRYGNTGFMGNRRVWRRLWRCAWSEAKLKMSIKSIKSKTKADCRGIFFRSIARRKREIHFRVLYQFLASPLFCLRSLGLRSCLVAGPSPSDREPSIYTLSSLKTVNSGQTLTSRGRRELARFSYQVLSRSTLSDEVKTILSIQSKLAIPIYKS